MKFSPVVRVLMEREDGSATEYTGAAATRFTTILDCAINLADRNDGLANLLMEVAECAKETPSTAEPAVVATPATKDQGVRLMLTPDGDLVSR